MGNSSDWEPLINSNLYLTEGCYWIERKWEKGFLISLAYQPSEKFLIKYLKLLHKNMILENIFYELYGIIFICLFGNTMGKASWEIHII